MRDKEITSKYENCLICPRKCGANRLGGDRGVCGMGSSPVINIYGLHYGEEPVISGMNGSGTVFFEGCSLKCVFCQNYDISRNETGKGRIYDSGGLAGVYLELQERHANNINLVTAGHFIPTVAESISIARDKGLTIPVAFNSGGYESVDSLKLLDGLIDIYMPDMKFFSSSLSEKLCKARDYYEVCCEALDEMYRQTGPAVIGSDGLMKKGMIVRHLMLPGQLFDTKKVLDDMRLPDFLQRKLPQGHYAAAAEYLSILGQENAFIQEDASGDELLPDFNT